MSLICKCDKCGKLADTRDSFDIWLDHYRYLNVDLCDVCLAEFNLIASDFGIKLRRLKELEGEGQ